MAMIHKAGHLSEETERAALQPGFSSSELRQRLIDILLRHQSASLAATAVVTILLQVLLFFWLQHSELAENLLVAGLVQSLPTILIIWAVGVLLRMAAIRKAEQQMDGTILADFSRLLGQARTWEEVVRVIIEFSHRVCSQATLTLSVVNPDSLYLEIEAVCLPDGSIQYKPQQPRRAAGVPAAARSATQVFALPITRDDLQVGLIELEYITGQGPNFAAIEVMQSAAPLMGIAIEGALLQSLAAEQVAENESQRQQIAQNLHDTLAQNISYLRLKLDQLTGENAVHEIGVVLAELERMRVSADEAYQQVRSTLSELNPLNGEDMLTSLSQQARMITQRAKLHLSTSQVGKPSSLPNETRLQVIYIAREALHNIEKHAQAKAVSLQVVWLEKEFILKITDDGVGFNPLLLNQQGHYGLSIMQNRAREINGVLKLSPVENQGTEVTLWVPIP